MDRNHPPARVAVPFFRNVPRTTASSAQVSVPAGTAPAAALCVMFIPTFQGLAASDLMRSPSTNGSCFPFDVPHLSFYRARNAIYYLFTALKARNPRLTVLVPDYNSGNEILALEAAG